MNNIINKNLFLTRNPYMTYHEKLKREIEKIPKLHKKFFIESLTKHKFDADVYIPQANEKNRKINPDKDYLLNKIVIYDNKVNKHKNNIVTISKDFSKFFKFYSNLKSNNNSKQREYMRNLATIYKEKNKNNDDIEYKKDENIFSNSVLLEGNTNNEIEGRNMSKFINPNDKITLTNDEKILIKLDRVIHKKISPNSKIKRSQNNNDNFITSLNQSYFTNKNKQLNNEIKTDLNNKEDNDNKNNKSISEKSIKLVNKKEKNNTLDKYLLNSRILKTNNFSRNDNKKYGNQTTNKAGINGINNLTYNKTNNNINIEERHKNFCKLRALFLNKNNKNENENMNIKTIKMSNDSQINKPNIHLSSNSQYSKYLLRTLNKIKIKDDINDISEINNKDKNKIGQENEINKLEIISKSSPKENAKINLPGINPNKDIPDKNNNLKTVNVQKKFKAKTKKKILIKKENSSLSNKKSKERDINLLYSTLATKTYFFREYPYNKIKNYFKKYKNITISNVEPEKGSNLYSILDNIENIVKDKDMPKLAKSLDETKEYLDLKKEKTENKELNKEKNMSCFDKVSESDKLFPFIKYNCAEKIIFS